MTFRTLVMLCLAVMAGGIMTRGASEGSLPSKRGAARRRAAKGSGSGGLWGVIADAVEGLADALEEGADEADETEVRKASSDEADEADEMEMHKTSLDAHKEDEEDEADEMEMHKTSLDEDKEDEEDEEDEEDMTPAERRTLSALRDFYGEERLDEVAAIMDRGLAPDASEDDKERAKEYLDKTAELAEAAGVSDAMSADETEMHKTSLDVDKDDEEDEEEDMTPAERQTLSALQDFYGEERMEEIAGIMDRGTAPDASEDDKERAKEYLDKAAELAEAAGVPDAMSAGEADETEMHKTSLDVDREDEEDEEEDMTPAELRTLSALQDFYGEERLDEVAGIVDRGMAPDASEDDRERAKEYLDKATELAGAADASDATSADEGGEMEMHQTSLDEARADREADEVVEHVVHGVGTIVDAVAPLATELLDAVLGDDEDEA